MTIFSKKPVQNGLTAQPKKKITPGKIVSVVIIVLSIIFVIATSIFLVNLKNAGSNVFRGGFDFGGLLQGKRTELKGEKEGRTNILILGKNDQQGDNLTDTIMIMSLYHKEKKIATLNIPRDMAVAAGNSYDGKINSILPYADENKLGSGIGEDYLADFLSKELGITIHYWVGVNITGARQVVDKLGGITVNVDNAFTDCEYPNDNYGYIRPCPHFNPGEQTMDGKTALIYARSRKSYDNPAEAIDFARSKRQQKVVEAMLAKLKDEITSGRIVLDPGKLKEYLDIFGNNVSTSMRPDEALSFGMLTKDFPDLKTSIEKYNLTYGDIICESSDGTTKVFYCGGGVMGGKDFSAARKSLREVASNLLNQSTITTLDEAGISIIGNRSDLTSKVKDVIINAGFTNVLYDNLNKNVAASTNTSVEKATVYITKPEIKAAFDQLNPKLGFDYDVKTEIPADYKLTTAQQQSGILVVIATVSQ